MKIQIKQIGTFRSFPAKEILLTTSNVGGISLTEDVTGSDGRVPTDLIDSLREIADDLEHHNYRVQQSEI